MFGKYLPSKLYSVHQKIPGENNDFFRRSLRVSNQQYKGGKIKKEGKSNGSRPWLMTHRNWLCGVVLRREAVRDLYSSSCKGFSPAHRGRQFRFVLLGIVFSFFGLRSSRPKNLFLCTWVGKLLMVFDVFEGVLNKWCSALWVGVMVMVVGRRILEWLLPLC